MRRDYYRRWCYFGGRCGRAYDTARIVSRNRFGMIYAVSTSSRHNVDHTYNGSRRILFWRAGLRYVKILSCVLERDTYKSASNFSKAPTFRLPMVECVFELLLLGKFSREGGRSGWKSRNAWGDVAF